MKIRVGVLTKALMLASIASLGPVACQSDSGQGSATGGSQSGGGSTKTGGSGGSASGGTTTSGGSGGTSTTSSSGGVGSGGSKSGGSTGTRTGTGGKGSGGATGSGGLTGTPGTGGSTSTGGNSGMDGAVIDGGHDSAEAGAGGSRTGGTTGGGGATSAMGGAGGGTSASCPSTVLKSGDTTVTLQSRKYILHVPSAYKGTSPVPLIVDFHPITGTASGEEGSSPFKAVTDPEGVITAYPQGESGPMGAAWNVGPCCVANVDDVGFAKAIVTDVESKACIDTKRIYAVGFSMGGGMSHYIACKAADIFAAVAPAAFDLLKGSAPAGNADDCKPARPIPVVSFRGTADKTAIYAGGLSSVVSGMPITFLGAKACWEKWGSINGCTDTPTYPTASGNTFNCSYYKQCQGDVQVGVCINSGDHAYGDGKIGWTFLKQFSLP